MLTALNIPWESMTGLRPYRSWSSQSTRGGCGICGEAVVGAFAVLRHTAKQIVRYADVEGAGAIGEDVDVVSSVPGT